MSHHLLLILHLLSAAIWVGGHLILVITILPRALKQRDPAIIFSFEKKYEPLGMTALALLVITGIWMTLQLGVTIDRWFSFSSAVERTVSTKMILLLATVLFAVSAQTRVIPNLQKSPARLWEMAIHIIAVTLLGIAMLVLGSYVRYGGI